MASIWTPTATVAVMAVIKCSKKSYFSFKHADFDARQIRRKDEGIVHVYRCRDCQCWHVGRDGRDRYGMDNRRSRFRDTDLHMDDD